MKYLQKNNGSSSRGRVRFPTGGKVHELSFVMADSVKFRNR